VTEPDLGWLCQEFVRRTPGAAHAVVTSADGVQVASSSQLPAERAEQVSSVTAGIFSLAEGAARCFEAGVVLKTLVELARGYLFVIAIPGGARLTVLAAPDCDTAAVGHQMGRFAEAVGRVLSPEPRQTPGSIDEVTRD
jgi:predicted regulator of Ras-like GTPase activity (Roadblock/LC7/MglB family)